MKLLWVPALGDFCTFKEMYRTNPNDTPLFKIVGKECGTNGCIFKLSFLQESKLGKIIREVNSIPFLSGVNYNDLYDAVDKIIRRDVPNYEWRYEEVLQFTAELKVLEPFGLTLLELKRARLFECRSIISAVYDSTRGVLATIIENCYEELKKHPLLCDIDTKLPIMTPSDVSAIVWEIYEISQNKMRENKSYL